MLEGSSECLNLGFGKNNENHGGGVGDEYRSAESDVPISSLLITHEISMRCCRFLSA